MQILVSDLSFRIEVGAISGGPHDGEQLLIPSDQHRLELRKNGRPYRYYRISPRPVLHCEALVAPMIGGRR